MSGVLVTQDGVFRGDLPVDAEAVVQDADATVRLRCVEIVAFVLEHGFLAQYAEPVGETLWNKELAVVLFRQFHGHVLSVSRRALADVNRHVEHSPLDATHQLALSERRALEMQPAHHAVARHALVVLHEMDGADFFVKLFLVVGLEEIAPLVLEQAGFDDHHAFYACLDYVHNPEF